MRMKLMIIATIDAIFTKIEYDKKVVFFYNMYKRFDNK